jgi:hypothetical protein
MIFFISFKKINYRKKYFKQFEISGIIFSKF